MLTLQQIKIVANKPYVLAEKERQSQGIEIPATFALHHGPTFVVAVCMHNLVDVKGTW